MKLFCYFESPFELERVLLERGWHLDCNHALRKHDAKIVIYGLSKNNTWLVQFETECQGIINCLAPWAVMNGRVQQEKAFNGRMRSDCSSVVCEHEHVRG